MGMFDDAMKNSVPGGNLATPIAVAVGALILGKLFGGSSAPASAPASPAPAQPVPTNVPAGSVLGGLSDLIGRLTAGGVAPQVNSWVGPGENQPVQPGQLGSALGQNTLNELSQRTGMSSAGTPEPTRRGAAAAHQSHDSERSHADLGRFREITATRLLPRSMCAAARSAVIPRHAGAARPCRAPAPDLRSDPRRLPDRPTTARGRARCRAPRAARASGADGSSSPDG